MLQVFKSRWRNRWNVYEVDTGGCAWLASFRSEEAAVSWVHRYYDDQ